MLLREWAARWNVPFAAVLELERAMGLDTARDYEEAATLEQHQQQLIMMEASRRGWKLWRNNVGALKDARGVPVRYGLANESAKMNTLIKSGDLIGWRPVTIAGVQMAQFVSVEVKEPQWKCNPNDKHTKAQMSWAELVVAAGGHAQFARGPDELT